MLIFFISLIIIELILFLWKYQQTILLKTQKQNLETQYQELKNEWEHLQRTHQGLRETHIKLETVYVSQLKVYEDKLQFFEKSEHFLKENFKSTCAEALKLNQDTFLQLAQTQLSQWQTHANANFTLKEQNIHNLITPIKDALSKVDEQIQNLEKSRQGSSATLNQQIQNLVQQQIKLEKETQTLAHALRNPQVRGQWGEMQLKRVVEITGMLPHVEFYEQFSMTTQEGRLRPDMIISMPNQGTIAIDAKVPLNAYLEAIQNTDPLKQKEYFKQHAKQVKNRIQELSLKTYWKDLSHSPEFVILFLPAEPFLSVALSEEPSLLELSSQQNVILATPTTLIALLKTIAYGWKQDVMAKEAQNIIELGRTLYERIATLGEHWDALGHSLIKLNQNYNKSLQSLETRLFPIARQLQTWNVSNHKPIPNLEPFDNPLLKKRLENVAFSENLT